MTQKDIYDYLSANPLGVAVHVGDLEDLHGNDYIFLDFLSDDLIGFDNGGIYKTEIQITVVTKDFENRKVLTQYVKDKFNVSVSYETSDEFLYFLARCRTEAILYEMV